MTRRTLNLWQSPFALDINRSTDIVTVSARTPQPATKTSTSRHSSKMDAAAALLDFSRTAHLAEFALFAPIIARRRDNLNRAKRDCATQQPSIKLGISVEKSESTSSVGISPSNSTFIQTVTHTQRKNILLLDKIRGRIAKPFKCKHFFESDNSVGQSFKRSKISCEF
jgi:hypothetical protein